MKMVRVQWRDSMGHPTWISEDAAMTFVEEDNLLHESVGMLLKETDDYIAMCLSRSLHYGNVGDILKIPREAVVKVEQLRVR